MGFFSRNRSKETPSAGKKLLQEFGQFSFWKSSSEFKDIKSALEKLEEGKSLEEREKANEQLEQACQKYLDLRKDNQSESGKQKFDLAQQVLAYQQFTACEIYHGQIKAMDNEPVTLSSAMKITQYSKKFQDAYETFQTSPKKSVIDIDKRNEMQKLHEDHLETNLDAVRSKPKLEEAIRQNKPWGQVSFPVPLVDSLDGAEKVGNAVSARSVVTINGKKGVFTEYTELTAEKATENFISSLPPGEIQSAMGNHFEDMAKLFDNMSTLTVNGTKESKMAQLKTCVYQFMTAKLEQEHLEEQKENNKDLIEVIETPEFEEVLTAMYDRAREFRSVRDKLRRQEDLKKKGDFDKRNELTSRMADALGMGNLIAHSEKVRMVRNGKVVEGNFMEFAEGYDVKSHDDEKRKILSEAELDDLGFQRDINRMELFDYLCGQCDRHDGNMIYTIGEPGDDGKRRITGIKGIDNDDAFWNGENQSEYSFNRGLQYISAADKELAEAIEKLDRQQLDFYLGDVLGKEHMDAVEYRLNKMKEHFKTCPKLEKDDWEKDVPAVKNLREAKGGIYPGIKAFFHLPERTRQFKNSLEVERGKNLEDDKRKLEAASKKYHEKVKAPELGTYRRERMKVNVKDLEREAFKDIQQRKQEFHQKKAAAQHVQKPRTQQERAMGR